MKKVISIILTFILLFSITGCSDHKKAAEEQALDLANEYYTVFMDLLEDYMYDEYDINVFLVCDEPIVDKVSKLNNKYKVNGTMHGTTVGLGDAIMWTAPFEIEFELNEDGILDAIDADYGEPDVLGVD